MVPYYTNVEQYSQFNGTILNFVLLFKFLINKYVSKNDFWKDFIDFLIILFSGHIKSTYNIHVIATCIQYFYICE